jgi:hypothetical protein
MIGALQLNEGLRKLYPVLSPIAISFAECIRGYVTSIRGDL